MQLYPILSVNQVIIPGPGCLPLFQIQPLNAEDSFAAVFIHDSLDKRYRNTIVRCGNCLLCSILFLGRHHDQPALLCLLLELFRRLCAAVISVLHGGGPTSIHGCRSQSCKKHQHRRQKQQKLFLPEAFWLTLRKNAELCFLNELSIQILDALQ